MTRARLRKLLTVTACATLATLASAGVASAHAIVSPPLAQTKTLQQFTLSVPTEKEGATTTRIELTVPDGFAIDSFEPASAGWTQQVRQAGSGEDAVVQSVVWTGGRVPTGQDAVFRFNASVTATKTYTFGVRQTYSDGSVVDWTGPDGSDDPAPTVAGVSSLGGGSGSTTLDVVALALAAVALLVALVALAGGRRPLT